MAFHVARYVIHKYFYDDDGNQQPWFFPDLVMIVQEWIDRKFVLRKDDTYLGLLLVVEKAHEAADVIYRAIVKSQEGEKRLLPILHPYNPTGSTRFVHFDTAKNVYATREDKCHINYVFADTESWEQKAAEALESMDEVICYVKNEGLGFTIPYTVSGRDRTYRPDFMTEEQHEEKRVLYPRDPSLDPQLVWKGKDEQDRHPLEVPNVPIYIQRRLIPTL